MAAEGCTQDLLGGSRIAHRHRVCVMLFTKARPAPSVKSFFSGKPLLPIGIAMSVLAGLALLGSLAGLKESPRQGKSLCLACCFSCLFLRFCQASRF